MAAAGLNSFLMCYKHIFREILTLFFILSVIFPEKIAQTHNYSNGFVVYCPCMGRFGNQADHFLGSLAFAHNLNRTLILPPWVEYEPGNPKAKMVPFDKYFKVEAFEGFQDVITMEKFMETLAADVWPPEKRTIFCYMARKFSDKMKENDCNAKDGNPFGPFWDNFDIEFVVSKFTKPLLYAGDPASGKKWNLKYPPSEYPVLAFVGAPADFPVAENNLKLQRYLQWSEEFEKKSDEFIKSNFPDGRFVGIHLRNGIDWKNACGHIDVSPNMFAAPQCLGYRGEHGNGYPELCMPPRDVVMKQVKNVLRKTKAAGLFIATDDDSMLLEFQKELKNFDIKVVRGHHDSPHLDLAILGKSVHYIGNCVSSFSAFAKRERDVKALSSSFWSWPRREFFPESKDTGHDEF